MRILVDKKHIQNRIGDVAWEIDRHYNKQDWYKNTKEPVIVLGVLSGGMFFMADLVRQLSIRTEMDFIRVSTYPGKATTAQKPRIIVEPTKLLHNAHILIVDDILDTGKTLGCVKEHLLYPHFPIVQFRPASIQTAVLLCKPGKAVNNMTADFVCCGIEDEWVVGYGLDYNGRYRNLPYVAVLE